MDEISVDQAIKELNELGESFTKIEADAKIYNHYEMTLAITVTIFSGIDNVKNDLKLRTDMWKSKKEWKELVAGWIGGKFKEIDVKSI